MRFLISLAIAVFSLSAHAVSMTADDWQPYPNNLPTFDYSGDKLKDAWPQLTLGTKQDFPDELFILNYAKKYPGIQKIALEKAAQPDAHPALKRILILEDYMQKHPGLEDSITGNVVAADLSPEFKAVMHESLTPLAEALQQAWRFHYQGQFKEAYQLGMQLGPAGAVPAIYSKLMYATFMLQSPKEKLEMFRHAADEAQVYLPLTPGYDFAEFGLLYARVRILERLNTPLALATGFLGSTQTSLGKFTEKSPDISLYAALLGGLQAGVVERVGSFIGRLTYGATEDRTIVRFDSAKEVAPTLPVVYNEYIVALSRINMKKHKNEIQKLASECATLTPFSAEEALNQALCNTTYKTSEMVKDNEVAANFDH